VAAGYPGFVFVMAVDCNVVSVLFWCNFSWLDTSDDVWEDVDVAEPWNDNRAKWDFVWLEPSGSLCDVW